MKYKVIKPKLFQKNRNNFITHLKNNSIAIFQSNDEFPKSGDQAFNFKQNADLFYLSGIDQEQTILLLFPECPNPVYREVLFLRKTNDLIKVWEGHKYTKEEAFETSGIQKICWIDEFESVLQSIIHYAENIYFNSNENDRYTHVVPYRDIRFANDIKSKYPFHNYFRSAPILRELRAIKSEDEIELTQTACNITTKAFNRVLKFTKPGVMEYEIEAEIIHEFIRNKATGHAYSPIIASGINATVLHYVENNQPCKDGDLILMDFGAEYGNYNADLSRTIPANGRFTARQKDVYNSVLHVFKETKKILRPGLSSVEYHEQVGEIMTEQLVDLKLISLEDVKNQNPEWPAYKKYFMHGTSHHLGLDVHDFANKFTPYAIGNILTIEPGIYIPEENLGVRIENDVLITNDGLYDFMSNTPIEIEEIEDIMNG